MGRQKRYPGVVKLANGRYRAILNDPVTGRNVSAATVLGQRGTTWETPGEAFRAREKARDKLQHARDVGMLIGEWWTLWTSSGLWERPKESTNIHNRERTKAFAARYASVPLASLDQLAQRSSGTVGDQIVSEWLTAGHSSTIPALCTMFNDARSRQAGRLLSSNPFAGLKITGEGRARIDPPTSELAARMVELASGLLPSFGMWLKFAMATGMRPGEIDALTWELEDRRGRRGEILSCHLESKTRVLVGCQFNNKTRTFTLPKNGLSRHAIVTPAADAALREIRDLGFPGPFVFPLASGRHMSQQSRNYWFRSVRGQVGWTGKGQDLYLATRHYAGKYLYNDLRLPAEDVAAVLGHTDRGELVRRLYGHFNDAEALVRVEERVRVAEAA